MCGDSCMRRRHGHGQRAGAVPAAAVRQAERQAPARKSAAACRTYVGGTVWRLSVPAPSCPQHRSRTTALLFFIGLGLVLHCHGHLPQPRRGPDAGRHPQAPAQPGQRHHQPDGRRGRHADAADDDDLSRHRGYAPLFRRIPCAGAGDGRLCGRAVLADQGTGLRG